MNRTLVPGTGLKTIPKLLVHVCPAWGPMGVAGVGVGGVTGGVLDAEGVAGGVYAGVVGGVGLDCEKSGFGPESITSSPPVKNAI